MPSTKDILAAATKAADASAVREAGGLPPQEGGEGGGSAPPEPSVATPAAATPASNGDAPVEVPTGMAATVQQLATEVTRLREQVERRDDPELDQRLEDLEELRKEVLRRHADKKKLAIAERKRRVAELADRIIQDPSSDIEGVAIRPRRPATSGSITLDRDDLKTIVMEVRADTIEKGKKLPKKGSGALKSVGNFFGFGSEEPEEPEEKDKK